VIVPILSWLVKHERDLLPEYRMALLLETHTLDLSQGDVAITVAHLADDQANVIEWALRYAAPDPAFAARRWCTDVGLARDGDCWHMSVVAEYSLAPGYVGQDLPPPPPAAPPLVAAMLGSPEWSAAPVGGFVPSETPHYLEVGKGHQLLRAIGDPTRSQPIVYVSLAPGGEPLCDPFMLAQALAGAAVVVVADSPELDTELDWLFLEDFRCYGGAIRVYLPDAALDNPRDATRHRYLSPSVLAGLSPAEVVQTVARGVLSWNLAASGGRRLTVDEVQMHALERRLDALRSSTARDENDLREYAALLEQETAHLKTQLRALGAQSQQVAAEHARAAAEADATIARLTRELARVHAGARADTRTPRVRPDLRALRELPGDLPAALDTICRVFPSRVRVTARARHSAETASMNVPREVRNVWRVLHALATTLYDLVFADIPIGDLPTRFRNLTGIELAITEGQQTKRDDRLMLLRRDVDDRGEPIDITPHLKLGDHPPRLLRVHFAIDRERRLLIIGHCGDHLDTFGTQRLK
jgi:hypothetical protein